MRKLLLAAMVAVIGLLPAVMPVAAQAQTPPQTQTVAKQADHRLLAVGAGAIVGVVVFNMFTRPIAWVPFAGARLAPVPYDIALGSRIIAALSGGTGALIAHYLYNAVN